MKIAVLYDIYGNYPALMVVLSHLNSMKPDLVILGGDLISGPMPLETMEAIEQLKIRLKQLALWVTMIKM
ncbi:metallophosphoesterase family protein [Liquorilactobacillus oeni]|uniref:Calcineurin-like phosphoesterase domain-containing protein n=1 Tax=Liquorilactobacillus oeni DSM 19972 TaxID=1423777 RepID=A0A0R1MAT5_9LACO|nr:metallophosphoesterase [Liquorilactobacillus oeni]KRL05142.1 hypothetical protein FD46_GL001092 [Liquorilactobacillus oeni DSM 19972]